MDIERNACWRRGGAAAKRQNEFRNPLVDGSFDL
jgi:hypothetical protein